MFDLLLKIFFKTFKLIFIGFSFRIFILVFRVATFYLLFTSKIYKSRFCIFFIFLFDLYLLKFYILNYDFEYFVFNLNFLFWFLHLYIFFYFIEFFYFLFIKILVFIEWFLLIFNINFFVRMMSSELCIMIYIFLIINY